MQYWIDMVTSPGGREYNEDTVASEQTSNGLIALVADGLGSHGGGDIASRAATDSILAQWRARPCFDKSGLFGYLHTANEAVIARQSSRCQMKSTAVALFCHDNRAAVAWAGDSRCYYFSAAKICYQTTDHSVSQLAVERGDITPAQIRFHEDRSRLLRALGKEGAFRADVAFLPKCVEPSDAFLLCSDGFWEYVTEREMETDLVKSTAPREWLGFLLARIGRRVDGKNDNLSAVAIFCH